MRPTMVVPIVVILLAAIAVLFVRSTPAEADGGSRAVPSSGARTDVLDGTG